MEGEIAQSISKHTMMLQRLKQQPAGTERQPQVSGGQKVPERTATVCRHCACKSGILNEWGEDGPFCQGAGTHSLSTYWGAGSRERSDPYLIPNTPQKSDRRRSEDKTQNGNRPGRK